MADHLETRLSALSDTPVPPLLPPEAVRARGDQRRRRQTAALGATAVLAAAVLGGGIVLGGGQDPQDALRVAAPPSASPTPSSSPTTPPSPSTSPSPSASTTPSPSASTTPSPSGTAEPSPSATAPPSVSPSQNPPSPAATEPPAPAFPEQAPPQHGSRRSAVYLAVAYAPADPELAQAEAQARAVGYAEVGMGEVSCDQGAREALGLDAERTYYAVTLYFADRPTAQQFVDAYEPGVVGIADVTTYCLD